MMEKTKTETLIDEMYDLVLRVNINEIASHFKDEELFSWTGAWRDSAVTVLKELEREVLNERD